MNKKEILEQIQNTYCYSSCNQAFYAIVNGFLVRGKDSTLSNFSDKQRQNELLSQYVEMEKDYADISEEEKVVIEPELENLRKKI